MAQKIQNSPSKSPGDIRLPVTQASAILDFLLLSLKKQSRNNVKSLLTHRQVSMDGLVVTRHDYPLQPGRLVHINLSVSREPMPDGVHLDFIYEDGDLIAINKPSGLLTIATDKEKNLTAYHNVTDYVRRSDPKARVFSVHRLDRDTSGVILFAKNELIKLALQDNWNELVSERGYLAVVEGVPAEQSGRIRTWLKETKTLMVYSSSVPGDGQEAITRYEVLSSGGGYSLLAIQLETGRKNQIRVHLKELGHPIVGDKKYGAKTNPEKRLMLHANRLVLSHPFTGETLSFEADAPKSFEALLKRRVK